MQNLISKIKFPLLATFLLGLKTYIVYKLAFNIKIETGMDEFILAIGPFSALLACIGLSLFRTKYRNGLVLTISTLLSILLFSNAVFYGFFNDFLTFPVLFQTNNMADLGTSIRELLTFKTFLMFSDIIVLLILLRLYPKHFLVQNITKLEKMKYYMGVFAIFICTTTLAELHKPALFTHSFDRSMIVKNLGIYNYHIYDILLQSRSSTQRAFARSNEFSEIENYLASRKHGDNTPLFGVAKNKNVIIISMESTQNFVINKKINGQEVTPFLNQLIKESYYFNNFYHQTGQGKTSDAEFIIENSLYPLDRGSVFFTHAQNEYTATPEILKSYNYYSAVFHSNDKSFWNRDVMYNALGYDRFFSQTAFTGTEQNSVGWGLKDKEFFQQAIPYLQSLPQPFYTKFLTLTNHFPFTLDMKDHYIDEYNSESPLVNRYFQTVRYTDDALKYFVTRLKEEGLYDNTVLIIYGDHYGISENYSKAMAQVLGKDTLTPFDNLQLQRVPLIVHIPGQDGGTIPKVAGQIDVKPTLLHLLGIKTQHQTEFGTDLFTTEKDHTTFLRDGSFVNENYSYTKGICYNNTGAQVKPDACKPYIEKAKIELNYSDKLIYGDLLRFDSNNKRKTETMHTKF